MGTINVEVSTTTAMGKDWRKMGNDGKDFSIVIKGHIINRILYKSELIKK
jgi:hypothetical protein